MTLPPWIEEDLLQDEAPDYDNMNDPWGHVYLITEHVGEAIVMLYERLSVINFWNRDEFYDFADFKLLMRECNELSSWLLAISGTVDSSDGPWIPLERNQRGVLNELGGLSFFNPDERHLSYDFVNRLIRTAAENTIGERAFRGISATERNHVLFSAMHIVSNAFTLTQDIDDDHPARYGIPFAGSEKLVWPVAQVNNATNLYHDGNIEEAGLICFKLLSGVVERYFAFGGSEHSHVLRGDLRGDLDAPGVVATAWNVRRWLSMAMQQMQADDLAQALLMPMSDDAWEEDRAIEILHDAMPGNLYLGRHDGDLMLLPVGDDDDDYDY